MPDCTPDVYQIEYKDDTTNGKWRFGRYTAIFNDKHLSWFEGYLRSLSNGMEYRLVKSKFTIEDFIREVMVSRTKELSNVL